MAKFYESGPAAKTSAKRIGVAERRTFTIALRKAGKTYDEIADLVVAEFGRERLPATYDKRHAYNDVATYLRVLRKQATEDVMEVIAIELERLDALLKGLWAAAEAGDLPAVDRALKVAERRAKLMGLDAPVRTTTEHDGELTFVVRFADPLPPTDPAAS